MKHDQTLFAASAWSHHAAEGIISDDLWYMIDEMLVEAERYARHSGLEDRIAFKKGDVVQIPFPDDAPGFIQYLAGLMAQKKFRGVFDRSFGLDDITEAFRYVELGQKTGIVVVDVRSRTFG